MKIISILITLSLSLNSFCADGEKKSLQESENELIDFSSVRDYLKKDGLQEAAQKKEKAATKLKSKRLKRKMMKYDLPSNNVFWSFATEYWLVKNAPLIKWDFQKPDYGLKKSFTEFLERMGYYEKNFKILLVDTPNISHFSLPSNRNEKIFLMSVPFIRTLDLTKLEISLLLFEDMLRLEMGYFEKRLPAKKVKKLQNGNFYGKKLDVKAFDEIFKVYDETIYVKGFSFQEQFEVTKKMESYLKSDLRLLNAYMRLLTKIDELVKSNLLYTKYSKIYPSPELQLNWIRPKKSGP
jgi:hypothetical protein